MLNIIPLDLTYICNWNCSYCDHKQIKNKTNATKEDIEKYLPLVLKHTTYDGFCLTGAEIGFLPKDILEYVLQLINKQAIKKRLVVLITTNGKYFDNNYHLLESKYKFIDFIYLYHCLPELKDIQVNHINAKNIIYTFVIHKLNIKKIESFLKINKGLRFIPMFYSYRGDGYERFLLSQEDYQEIDLIFKRNKISIGYSQERLNNMLIYNDEEKNHIRKLCSRNKPIKVIDFINKKIRLCNTTFTQNPYIDLTEENLKTLNSPKEIYDPICDNCDNLYYPVGHIFYNQDKYEPSISITEKWQPQKMPIAIMNNFPNFIWQFDITQCNIYMKKQLLGESQNGK